LSEQLSSHTKLGFHGKLVPSAVCLDFNQCVESLVLVLGESVLLLQAEYLRGEPRRALEAFEGYLD
jgi:hypothetical protein